MNSTKLIDRLVSSEVLAITSSQTTASPKGSSSGALPAAAAARESCVSTGSIEIEPSRAIPS